MQDEDGMIADMAAKHGVSKDGVRTVFQALQSSGGKMAQFSHPDFGGMSQWSGGMTMVGDMFNDGLKAKLNALCQDLAHVIGSQPAGASAKSGDGKASSSSSSSSSSSGKGNWWPDDLGSPGSTGSQNQMRYAIFPDSHRLVVDDNGRQTIYDTGDHRISGISQSQSSSQTLAFTSQSGPVKIADFKVVKGG